MKTEIEFIHAQPGEAWYKEIIKSMACLSQCNGQKRMEEWIADMLFTGQT